MNAKTKWGNPLQINHWDIKDLGSSNIAIIDANVVIEGYDIKKIVKEECLPLIPRETLIEAGILNEDIFPITSSVSENALKEVYNFYGDPLKKIGLQKITEQKIANILKYSKESDYKIAKKFIENKRTNDYHPENGDYKLLAYCLSIKKRTTGDLILITKDNDFKYFSKELKENYGISVMDPENLPGAV